MRLATYLFFFSFLLLYSCSNQAPKEKDQEAINLDSLSSVLDTLTNEAEALPTNASDEMGFIRTYEGTIGDNNPVVLSLINWGDGTFSGSYYYKKIGKEIEIFGESQDGHSFLLEEYVGEENTGSFYANFDSYSKIVGEWKDIHGGKVLPFSLKALANSNPNNEWTGTWFMNGIWDGGTLIIGNETDKSFEFALSFTRLGHVGILDGKAQKKGNSATFQHLLFNDEEEACVLNFALTDEYINLEQKSSNMACGFGFRAFAGGKYENDYQDLKATLSHSGEDSIFMNQSDHDAFLALVGQDFYDLFAFNMQGFDLYEMDIKDQFQARAIAGAAVGFYGSNEAIIMHDQNKTIWAATIEWDEMAENPQIHYFSNSQKYKSSLPFTIQNWKDSFSDYPVKYHFKQ